MRKEKPWPKDKRSPCCGAPVVQDSYGDNICGKCFINLMQPEFYE